MLLAELVETSRAVGATSARREKVALLAGALRRLERSEIPAGVAFLSGELRQRQIGVAERGPSDADLALAQFARQEGDSGLDLGRLEPPQRVGQVADLLAARGRGPDGLGGGGEVGQKHNSMLP